MFSVCSALFVASVKTITSNGLLVQVSTPGYMKARNINNMTKKSPTYILFNANYITNVSQLVGKLCI